jgi:hypothetical protein
MQYFDITKEKMHFPFVFFSDTISSEDFYDKDYYIMVPPSFIEDCKKANMDLKNELESFENNKLFQYSETGNYKLLIEYLEDGLVAVTHFNKIKEKEGQFSHTTYTFKTLGSNNENALKNRPYKLTSITF